MKQWIIKGIKIKAVLLSIMLFHLFNNYIWIKTDCLFIYPKEITNTIFHLHNQLRFYQKLRLLCGADVSIFSKIKSFFSFFESGNVGPQHEWPVFAYFITSMINLLFGMTLFMSRFSNCLFLAALIIFTYLIAKHCENKRAGLIAAFLVSFYPAVFGIARLYDLDFHLIAMTAAVIYFLVKSKNFVNKKHSILAGLCLGLGILTKGQILIFIIGPLLYILYNIARRIIESKKQQWQISSVFNPVIQLGNLFIFLALSLGISFIWWRWNFKVKFDILLDHFFVGYFPNKYNLFGLRYDIFSPRTLFYHFLFLIKHVSMGLYLIFCINLFWVKKKIVPGIQMVILWILTPLFIFTLMSAKWEHYCLPVLPGVAVLTAVGIERACNKIKIPVILFLLVFSLVQFFRISYGSAYGSMQKTALRDKRFLYESIYGTSPKKNNYQEIISRFAKKIKENAYYKDNKDSVIDLGIVDVINAEINSVLISYYMDLYMDKIENWCLPNGIATMPEAFGNAERFSENVDNMDFVIVVSNSSQAFIGSENDLDLPKDLLSEFSYQRIIDSLFKKRMVIDRGVLWPDRKSIFLLAKAGPVL